jgi:hypothetical protein
VAGAIVGIVWLPFIFGPYFALRLARSKGALPPPWRPILAALAGAGLILASNIWLGKMVAAYGFKALLLAFWTAWGVRGSCKSSAGGDFSRSSWHSALPRACRLQLLCSLLLGAGGGRITMPCLRAGNPRDCGPISSGWDSSRKCFCGLGTLSFPEPSLAASWLEFIVSSIAQAIRSPFEEGTAIFCRVT